ncbi:MAG: hypothetical protein U5O39_13970 [Gammaproteobacteria bacterium]|nr:hypothetical protein [Gammaproteobacteria bacterium]
MRTIDLPVTVVRAEPRNPEETVLDFSKSPAVAGTRRRICQRDRRLYHPELSISSRWRLPGWWPSTS